MKKQLMILTWMRDSLNSYCAEIALSKSDLTVEYYRKDLEMFFDYLCFKNIRRLSTLKPLHVIEYLGKCNAEGKSDSTLNRYFMSIRSYCRFLRRNKFMNEDISQDIHSPTRRMPAPRVPTLEEVNKLLEQPDTSTESGLRDRAILELLYSSGLRATELCDLQLNHFGEDNILVSCGKRGKTRTVPITDEAHHWITKYIEEARGKHQGPLFTTLRDKAIRRQYLFKMVTYYAQKAGLDEVTTHTLRHACATHLLDSGADLRLIQEVLGHSSIASTQRYTHLSSNKMQSMFQQFHPRKTTQLQEATA